MNAAQKLKRLMGRPATAVCSMREAGGHAGTLDASRLTLGGGNDRAAVHHAQGGTDEGQQLAVFAAASLACDRDEHDSGAERARWPSLGWLVAGERSACAASSQ